MMSSNPKKNRIVTTVVGGVLVVTLITPGFARAAATSSIDEAQKAKNFCTNLSANDIKAEQKYNDKEASYAAAQADRESKILRERAEKDAKLAEERSRADQKRAETLAKVTAKATTTAQIAAVNAYKTSVQAAIATRRSAVDAAIAAYRAGIDKAIADRRTGITAAKTALKTSTDAAYEKAKADCANGIAPAVARSTMKASLKNTRAQFNSSVKTLEKAKSQIQALNRTKKVAIEKAQSDFKKATEAALATLKIALK